MQRVDTYKTSVFWEKPHSSRQLMIAINQGKCAKTSTTDKAVQELTDYKDDLRDDVIDYALLGI